jgi:hypothetical protein
MLEVEVRLSCAKVKQKTLKGWVGKGPDRKAEWRTKTPAHQKQELGPRGKHNGEKPA